MIAAVMLLVATGRDLSMHKYHRTNRNFWEDDDAIDEKREDIVLGDENSFSLIFRKLCLKRENRMCWWSLLPVLYGAAAWSEMEYFKLLFHE